MTVRLTDVTQGVKIEAMSIAWLLVEASVALGSGIAAHSVSLTSFGADSVIELISGFVLLWRLSVEARGAGTERIARAERFASWVVGIALLLLSLYIFAAALHEFVTHTSPQPTSIGLALALASGLLMPVLAGAKRRVGAKIGSAALKSDASCSIVCAYMAWTVVAGVALTALFNWWWADAAAALLLIYFVAHEGMEAVEAARSEQKESSVNGK